MAKKINFEGFKPLICNARKLISKYGGVDIYYIKGSGFVCRGKVSPNLKRLISEGQASHVGHYETPVKSKLIIEDLNHELNDQIGLG